MSSLEAIKCLKSILRMFAIVFKQINSIEESLKSFLEYCQYSKMYCFFILSLVAIFDNLGFVAVDGFL